MVAADSAGAWAAVALTAVAEAVSEVAPEADLAVAPVVSVVADLVALATEASAAETKALAAVVASATVRALPATRAWATALDLAVTKVSAADRALPETKAWATDRGSAVIGASATAVPVSAAIRVLEMGQGLPEATASAIDLVSTAWAETKASATVVSRTIPITAMADTSLPTAASAAFRET